MDKDNSENQDKGKAKGGKYLIFLMAQEEYGIEILKIQEIIGIMPLTRVPLVPDYVSGVINLRGRVIPVMDLRLKFSIIFKEYTEKTCTIIVQARREDKEVTMGIIVDEVVEVEDIREEQIEPPPDFGKNVETEYIMGVGKLEQKVVMLMNIDRIVATSKVEELGDNQTKGEENV